MLAAVMAGALTLLLFVFVRRSIMGRLAWDHLDLVWASPLGYGVLYLGLLAVLVPILLIRPALGARLSAGMFGGFTVLSVMILFPRISQLASIVLALGAGVEVYRLSGKSLQRLGRVAGRLSLALTVTYAIVLGVTLARRATIDRSATPMRGDARSHPNIVLLMWDTVRAASVSAYGYPVPTTPSLQAFAREGVLFERAYANAPWTLPSHASIFTGRLPGELTADWQTPLDPAYPTLAQVLRNAGYATVGLSGNAFYGGSTTGLARGFEAFREHRRSWRQILYSSAFGQTASLRRVIRHMAPWAVREAITRPHLLDLSVKPVFADYDMSYARNVTDDFIAWRRAVQGGERPYFAFLNFIDAHETEGLPPWEEHVVSGAKSRQERYDREIMHLDSQFARILEALDELGELDRTIVIVTSDHGEHFGEHGIEKGHGVSLYEPTLRVPLVIRFPSAVPPGRRVAEPVELRDLGATILSLAGVAAPFPGRALVRRWSGDAPGGDTLVAEVSKRIRESEPVPNRDYGLKSLRTDSLSYIRRQDGTEEMFAYRTDSLETVNLVNHPLYGARLAVLRAHLMNLPLAWR